MAPQPSKTLDQSDPTIPITFDEQLFADYMSEEDHLDQSKFADELHQRFLDLGLEDADKEYTKHLAKYIWLNIPENARTKGVARAIDISEYVRAWGAWQEENANPVNGKKLIQHGSTPNQGVQVPKYVELSEAQAYFDQLVIDEKQMVVDYIQTVSGKKYTPSEATEGQATLSPVVDRDEIAGTTNPVDQAEAAAEVFAGGTVLAKNRVSRDELQNAFIQSYSTDVMDLISMEQGYTEQGMTVDPTQIQIRTMAPGTRVPPDAKVTYSVPEAANYLLSSWLRPKDITQLQKNMAAAGYFDTSQLGYVEGDPLDPETIRAWRAALADSVKTGVPVDQMLRTKAGDRNRNFDPGARLAASRQFNEVSQQLLGRNLSSEEIASVLQHMQTIANTQGLRTNDPAVLASGIDQNVAQDFILSTTGREQDQMALQSQINEYQKAFGAA